jgi:triacylglycerol lipase
LAVNLFAGTLGLKTEKLRLKICGHGTVLLTVFVWSLAVAVAWHAVLAFYTLPNNYMRLIWSAVFCVCAEAIVFWNGILSVYLASFQIGIKLRVVGVICGMIPVANLIVLGKIINTVRDEVEAEVKRECYNRERAPLKLCDTKYPILFVHGVFFRDFKYFNYWGRIPEDLIKNGARIYYGEHQSALSVADSADELAERIKNIVNESGCEKLNIIAHSKGGLDCRYAIDKLGVAPYIASLTTVNTPHRGCIFAERLLECFDPKIKEKIANAYNKTLKLMGDKDPDFIAAVSDLTADACRKRNDELNDPPANIFCQSVGSIQNKASSGRFPMNLSYHIVKLFDGPNDGLVGETSFEWGEKYTLVTVKGDRGVSHGDMIDLNRENFDEFDVREFYVELVKDLKEKGL